MTGSKEVLVKNITDSTISKGKRAVGPGKTAREGTVNARLKVLGIDEPEGTSKCCRKGITKGLFSLDGTLIFPLSPSVSVFPVLFFCS